MNTSRLNPTWTNSPSEPAGVMVGSDAQQEWLLPWWHECYYRHNRHPIEFVDFGMSPKGQQFCAARGRLLDVTELTFKAIWYEKPFAILKTRFEHCLWLDNDCEVRGPLPIAPASTEVPLDMVVARDPYGGPQFLQGLYADEVRYTSAPSVSRHGNELVPIWAYYCLVMSDYCLGDQHALCRAIYLNRTKVRIGEFPPGYVRFRLGGEPGNALVMHWTGPAGKAIIKQQMSMSPTLRGQTDPVAEGLL